MYFTCRHTTSVILSEIVVLSQSQPHEGQGKQHRWPFPLNQQLFQHVVMRSHMALIHTLTHLHLPTTTQPQFQIYDARCKALKTTQQYSLILHLHLNWDIVIVQRFFFLLLFTVFYVVLCLGQQENISRWFQTSQSFVSISWILGGQNWKTMFS